MISIEEKFNFWIASPQGFYNRLDCFFRWISLFNFSLALHSLKENNLIGRVHDHRLNFAFDKSLRAAL